MTKPQRIAYLTSLKRVEKSQKLLLILISSFLEAQMASPGEYQGQGEGKKRKRELKGR